MQERLIFFSIIFLSILMTIASFPQGKHHENHHRPATMRPQEEYFEEGSRRRQEPSAPKQYNPNRIMFDTVQREEYRPQDDRRLHKRQDFTTARPRWEHQHTTAEPSRVTVTQPTMVTSVNKPPKQSHNSSQGNDDWETRLNFDGSDCDETRSQAQRRSASLGTDGDSNRQHSVPMERCKAKTPSWESTQAPRPPVTTPGNTTGAHTVKALGTIVFPDGTMFPSFAPRRQSCNGTTFCTRSDGYPFAHINNILQQKGSMFRNLFGKDEVEDPALRNRIDQSDESPLCASVETVVFPKEAQNKEDQWKWVVNQAPYIQGVRIETCVKEGSTCQLTDSLPIGYKTYCRQKYIYRKMLGVNENGETASDSFKLPSCCSCFVKMDPVTRMLGLSPLPKNMNPTKASKS